jgi:ribosomal protein S18 acetylase RimI-like enzyme
MGQLSYSLFKKKDIPATVECITKVFLYDEPMTKILKIKKSEFKIFIESICEKAVKEKMSYICKDGDKVVGFRLNEDLISEPIPESIKITKKIDPIFALLDKLEEKFLKNKRRIKGKYFHLFMVGSLKEYQNRGIAKKLINKTLLLAKKKKFKKAVTKVTNIKSKTLLKKHFNFEEITKINYKTFKFRGESIFKNIDEKACTLMTLKLK